MFAFETLNKKMEHDLFSYSKFSVSMCIGRMCLSIASRNMYMALQMLQAGGAKRAINSSEKYIYLVQYYIPFLTVCTVHYKLLKILILNLNSSVLLAQLGNV